ncbi:hypothetical protein JOF28_000933 [Leucobacter exalbidus]|uniref:DUF4192 family protein n=1 Tax=Leucobacter exalbidus TaxID=662960 RepID=A0A940PUX7_9MICO|nr:DUF4192 family protein [Leucobacter exalbidus]MBP1325701.1 hypothetical protein [Leucobacter exalbidus]
MTDHNAPAPKVLSCSGTADFLAALPQLTGFTATNSLFVLFFAGSRTREAMRIDLPPNDNPREATDLLEFLSYAIRSFGAAQGSTSDPAIAIMSEQSFAECQGPPWQRLARRIERRLRRDQVRLRELCVLAPDGWQSYLDPHAPRLGRSLDDIRNSPISVAAALAQQRIPSLAELGAIPEVNPRRAQCAARALSALQLTAPDRVSHAAQVTRQLCAPDTRLSTEALLSAEAPRSHNAPFSAEASGHLAYVLERPAGWWHVAMGMITRPEFPGELAQDLGPQRFASLPVDEPPSAGAVQGPGSTQGCSMYALLAAVCPEFADRTRLAPLSTRLARAIADVPTLARPGLFALSALVWWLCGNQTTAYRHVDAAIEISPEHEISHMVRRLVSVPLAARQMLPPPPSHGGLPRSPRAAASQ